MTKAHLHNDPKFKELFADPRFMGAILYLRKNIGPKHQAAAGPDQLIHKGGKIEGWLECVDALENLQFPDRPTSTENPTKAPYTS
jgi:hypothetical protein